MTRMCPRHKHMVLSNPNCTMILYACFPGCLKGGNLKLRKTKLLFCPQNRKIKGWMLCPELSMHTCIPSQLPARLCIHQLLLKMLYTPYLSYWLVLWPTLLLWHRQLRHWRRQRFVSWDWMCQWKIWSFCCLLERKGFKYILKQPDILWRVNLPAAAKHWWAIFHASETLLK